MTLVSFSPGSPGKLNLSFSCADNWESNETEPDRNESGTVAALSGRSRMIDAWLSRTEIHAKVQ